MKYYEVQRFVAGQWEPYSIFDEQTLAIDAAKGLMSTGRPPSAVRVVEEDEDGSPPRTLFRETAVDGHNKEAAKRQLDNTREVEAARAARALEKARAKGPAAAAKKSKPINWWMMYLRLAVVLTVGWFVVVLFRHY
jgi:hypothetical protein